MPSPFIGGRIPQDLHDTLQKHITESGEKLPQVLQKALSNYLGYTPATNQNRSDLEERVTSLEISLEELRKAFEKVQQAPPLADARGNDVTLPGQLSLLDSDNSSDSKSAIEDENTDNDFDITTDNSHAPSDIVADSSPDITEQELTHEQVAKMVGKTVGAVRSSHGRKRILEDELYKYIPGGRPNHPKWIVEKR